MARGPRCRPYECEQLPVFETELLDIQQEGLAEEVIRFYEDTLIPQLACAPDGSSSPHPQIGWLKSESDPRHIVACKIDGELRGAWIIKRNQIYYPCAISVNAHNDSGYMQWSVLFMS